MNQTERKKYQPEHCLEAIKVFHAQTGQVSSSAYVKWRLKHPHFLSIMSIYSTVGKWKEVIDRLSIVKTEKHELKPVVTKQLCKKALRVFFSENEHFTSKEYQKWQKNNPYYPTILEINALISWKDYKKQLMRRPKLQKKTAV